MNASDLYERAQRVIPTAAQTYSKAADRFPHPLFLESGWGCKVSDHERWYIDYIGALGPVILGYRDEDVDAAIQKQLTKKGISFSAPTEIEVELAELLCEIIPCAEMVRFAKNGADATAAAVRLARAYTDREFIMSCGYHGYQDWCIFESRGLIDRPTYRFDYNDLDKLESWFEKIPHRLAAVILEPITVSNPQWPAEGFLQGLRDYAQNTVRFSSLTRWLLASDWR